MKDLTSVHPGHIKTATEVIEAQRVQIEKLCSALKRLIYIEEEMQYGDGVYDSEYKEVMAQAKAVLEYNNV